MIGHSSNKLAFGIESNMIINLLNQELRKIQDFTAQIDADEVIKLSQIIMKRYYDNKHQPKFFNVDDDVML